MGRAGVDYDTIREAAERLEAQGIAPTHERVRSQVGGGSFSTIGKHLQHWRLSRLKPTQDPAHPLPDPISEAARGIWSRLHAEFEEKLVAEKEAFAQQLANNQEEAARVLEAERQAFDAVKAEKAQTIAEQEREAERLTISLRDARGQLERTREALRAAELARADAEGERDALASQNEGLRKDLDHAHALTLDLRAEAETTRRINAEVMGSHISESRREHEYVAGLLSSLPKLCRDSESMRQSVAEQVRFSSLLTHHQQGAELAIKELTETIRVHQVDAHRQIESQLEASQMHLEGVTRQLLEEEQNLLEETFERVLAQHGREVKSWLIEAIREALPPLPPRGNSPTR